MIVPMASDANSHTSLESEQIPRQVEPQSSHLKSGIWMREELELLRNHLPSYKKLKRRQRTSYLTLVEATLIHQIWAVAHSMPYIQPGISPPPILWEEYCNCRVLRMMLLMGGSDGSCRHCQIGC